MRKKKVGPRRSLKGTLFDLSGRVALVTGGGQGLGRAIALGFAGAGADVMICGRHEKTLKAVASEIRRHRVRAEYMVCDLTRREESAALAKAAQRKMRRVDILVNNAGTNVPQPTERITDEDWDRVLELNVSSSMALSRALAPGMKKRGWGRIIHMSSVMAFASSAGRAPYSATKAALVGLARGMALDLAPRGITVNCLAPGPFLTELPLSLLTDRQKKSLSGRTAFGRWADPDELVGPALLLASDAGSFVTGETLIVDGGFLCKTF
jgi:NAD(P)-dependent dehydrogenase (short-subunit alcohol dehydrogenase family)